MEFHDYCKMLSENKEEKIETSDDLKNFMACLKKSVFDRETIKIGGGIFKYDELKKILKDLESKL